MKTSELKPFFTRDLIVDRGEPLNAFWGYHLANNYDRITGIAGTCFFSQREHNREAPVDAYFDIPLGDFAFHAIPAVQLSVCTLEEYTWSTVYFYYPHYYNAVLTKKLDVSDRQVSCQIQCQEDDLSDIDNFYKILYEGRYQTNARSFFVKVGDDNDEVMYGLDFTSGVTGVVNGIQTFWADMRVIRGYGASEPFTHNDGDRVFISPNDRSFVTDLIVTSVATRFYPNSPLVEGVLDNEKLRIRWLSDDPGTVTYRIFGG